MQAKGQEQTSLQSQCEELQQEVDLLQAQHAKVTTLSACMLPQLATACHMHKCIEDVLIACC